MTPTIEYRCTPYCENAAAERCGPSDRPHDAKCEPGFWTLLVPCGTCGGHQDEAQAFTCHGCKEYLAPPYTQEDRVRWAGQHSRCFVQGQTESAFVDCPVCLPGGLVPADGTIEPWYCFGAKMAFESHCPGPWPRQSEADLIDNDGFDHSACGPAAVFSVEKEGTT